MRMMLRYAAPSLVFACGLGLSAAARAQYAPVQPYLPGPVSMMPAAPPAQTTGTPAIATTTPKPAGKEGTAAAPGLPSLPGTGTGSGGMNLLNPPPLPTTWFPGPPGRTPSPITPAFGTPGVSAPVRPAIESGGIEQAPHMTQGAVFLEEEGAPPPAATVNLAWLRWQIQAVCGRLARDLQIEPLPDGGLVVHIHTENATTAGLLRDRVLRLPEMTTPMVHLDVQVLP